MDALKATYQFAWLVLRLATQDAGQTVVEYGLLIGTIGLVVLLAIGAFGARIQAWFGTLAGHITTTGT